MTFIPPGIPPNPQTTPGLRTNPVAPPSGPTPTTGGALVQGSNLLGSAFTLDNGWWVFIGCLGALLLSGTVVAPISTGILGVALIYQLNLLLKGK